MMIANRMSSITISAFMDAITDDVSDSICRRSDNRASMVSPMRSSESASDPPTSLCEATAVCRRTRSLLPVRFAMSSSAATISPSICIAPAQARSSDFRGSSEFSPTERRALSIEDPARMFSATMGSDRANCSSNRALRLFPRERTHSSAIRGPMRAKPIPISPRAMNPMRAPAPASKTRRMDPYRAVDFNTGFRKAWKGRGDFFVLIVRLAGSKGSRIPHAAYIAGSRQPAEQGVEADGDGKQ